VEEGLGEPDGSWHDVIADPHSLQRAVEALEALRRRGVAPGTPASDFVLKIAGYSYEETRERTPVAP
jgi:hypothetical protein